MTRRVLVAGSREIPVVPVVRALKEVVKTGDVLICGMCPTGADEIGRQFWLRRGWKIVGYPANWDKYGVGAGMIRNRVMADNCDIALVFWDSRSLGTRNMIDHLVRKCVPMTIYSTDTISARIQLESSVAKFQVIPL